MKLYIKNMVSTRCKTAVKNELTKLGLHCQAVDLGEADIVEDISPDQYARLKTALRPSGLELMEDRKSMLVQRIKTIIIELVHYSEEPLIIKLSAYLSLKTHYNYTYLANLFSEIQGATIEKFFLNHKIERVKEFLVYDELSLTEIAYRMHYSSVAHLSGQFKKITGETPSHFKHHREHKRCVLEEL